MNKDRGTMKWTAMMLPEHVKLLREWQAEDQLVIKPQLDEAQVEQMNTNLQRAYKEQCSIRLKVWEETAIYNVSGVIQKMNPIERYVQLADGQKISFKNICDALLDD